MEQSLSLSGLFVPIGLEVGKAARWENEWGVKRQCEVMDVDGQHATIKIHYGKRYSRKYTVYVADLEPMD